MTTPTLAPAPWLMDFEPLRPWLNRVSSTPSETLAAELALLPPEELERLACLLEATRFKSSRALDGYMRREPRFPSATQRAFLCTDDVEHVLFGGAAGGGKSSALLGAALQYVDEPGYAALLFRRTFEDLKQPDALIPRSHQWLQGTSAHWNGSDLQWRFPSGAVLKFGHLKNAQDEEKYQGAAAQFWGFDEAGQLEPRKLQYLTTRARRPLGSSIPIRFRYSANPGGHAHQWLADHFLVPHAKSAQWKFIPSKAADNPGLDVADYLERLSQLEDVVLLAQMRDGDWTAVDRTAMVCPEFTAELQRAVVVDRPRPEYFQPYVACDPGSTDLFVTLFGYLDFEAGELVVEDEVVLSDPTTQEAGEAIAAAEARLWAAGQAEGRIQRARRRSDHDRRLIKDLEQAPYRLLFLPAEKMDADSDRRACRTALKRGKIRINPRCRRLIATLANARRTPSGDYERTPELGHADAWDALRYLRRHVSWEENPFPAAKPHRERHPLAELKARTEPRSQVAQALSGGFKGLKPL